jgi:DNA-binding XRE family transcriptional regulator
MSTGHIPDTIEQFETMGFPGDDPAELENPTTTRGETGVFPPSEPGTSPLSPAGYGGIDGRMLMYAATGVQIRPFTVKEINMNPNPKPPPPGLSIGPRTLKSLRRALRFHEADLDAALQLPPGSYAAAEAGTIRLGGPTVIRLRRMVEAAEDAGNIPTTCRAGPLLRQARIAKGMTQAEVAEKCGWNQARVSRLEMAESPRVGSASKYAAALGLTLEFVRGVMPQTETRENGGP